jgi:hypothetical protein
MSMTVRGAVALSLALMAGSSLARSPVAALGESDQIRLEAIATIAADARFLCVGVVPDTTWSLPPGLPPKGTADASPLLLSSLAARGWKAVPILNCSLSWTPNPDPAGTALNPIKVSVGAIWFAASRRKAYVDVYTTGHGLVTVDRWGRTLVVLRPGKYGRRLYFQLEGGKWRPAEGLAAEVRGQL